MSINDVNYKGILGLPTLGKQSLNRKCLF